MVQATVNRILSIIPLEHIFFVANQTYSSLIEEQIPGIPRPNIIEEPTSKHTAPCIGLAALHMQQLDPNAVMTSLHSDHFIADEESFRQALLASEELAKQGYLVTLGITPDKLKQTHPLRSEYFGHRLDVPRVFFSTEVLYHANANDLVESAC